MEIGMILKWYLILDIAFLITSLFTLHFPGWRIAKSWAKKYLEKDKYPSARYIFSHTIAYIIVAFIVFPALAFALLLNNKEALTGYSKTLIEGLQNEET